MGTQLSSIDQVPQALTYLINKVEMLEQSVKSLIKSQQESNQKEWMTIVELCEYLPTHPARQTIYEWVKAKTIPYHKTSKMLTFNKNEIDQWLHGGYRKTLSDLEREADAFLESKKRVSK